MASVEHYGFKPDEYMRLNLYKGDVRSVEVRIEGDGIPLKVGESFTCTVVGLTREVVER